MSEEGRKVGTLSCRGEDLASALMLRPHCRNQVSSYFGERKRGGAEVRKRGKAEKRRSGKQRMY